MKFYLRLWRFDGCWVPEYSETPLDQDSQKTIDSVVGFQPDETMLDITVIGSENRRQTFAETDYSPAEYSSRIVIDAIHIEVDNKRQSFSNMPLLEKWLREQYHEKLVDACA